MEKKYLNELVANDSREVRVVKSSCLTKKRSGSSGQKKKLFFGVTATVFVAVASVLIFYGCQKDGSMPFQKNNGTMRVFDSWDALYAEMEMLNNMDEEALRAYEDAKGYQSFGRIAEDIYFPLVEDDCNITIEQEHSYVAQYPQYLTLNMKSEEEGGNEFIMKYDACPYSYVMNSDRMFRVGNDIYKVFEWAVLGIPFEKMDCLFDITEENIEDVVAEINARDLEGEEGENPDNPTQKSRRKFVEWELYLQGYLGGGIGGYKNANWKGGGTIISGDDNGGGGGGGGGGTTSNYGTYKDFYEVRTYSDGSQKKVTLEVSLIEENHADYHNKNRDGYHKTCIRAYYVVRGYRRCCPSKDWKNYKDYLSVDFTMMIRANTITRSGTKQYTTSNKVRKTDNLIIGDYGLFYNGNASDYYIRAVNGNACIVSEVCANANLNAW